MAIKINLESTKIPVEIDDLKFEIDVTDKKYEGFIQKFNRFLGEIERLDEENTEDVNKIKTLVEEIYEELLGTNSYKLIYAKMPNIAFVSSVLINVVTQLIKEMEARMTPTQTKLQLVSNK